MRNGKALHIILAVLAVLYLTGHILLNNKKIQQDAAVHVVKIAQSALDTDVTAGRVQFVYPFGITIDDLTVYDLNNDTLAYAASVSLRFKPLQLLWKKISITSVRVQSPGVFLRKDSLDAQPNYAFLTKLKGNGDSSSMTFRANSVLVRNGTVKYDVMDQEETQDLFNMNHIGITGLTANLSLKSISSDSIAFIVRKLSLSEQSGFRLSRAKGALTVGEGFTHLTGFYLATPGSHFEISELLAQAGLTKRGDGKGIPDFETVFTASVTGSDFKAFFPQTSGMTEPVILRLSCSARNNVLSINALHANDRKGTFALNGYGILLTGTDDLLTKGVRNARLYGDFSQNLPQWIDSQFSGFGFTVPSQCHGIGNGNFNISMGNEAGKVDTKASINSDAGIIDAQITGAEGIYQCSLTGSDILLDSITGNRDLGRCNLTARATLTKADEGYSCDYGVNIGSLMYKRYDYRDIAVNGSAGPGRITSKLVFSDRNGSIVLDAGAHTAGIPAYELDMTAQGLNLSSYNLAANDSITISAKLHANLEGPDIDRIQGKISVDDLDYSDTRGDWHMDKLTATIWDMNEQNKLISVFGDFLSISIVGDYNISSIPYSFSRYAGDVLPTIGKMVAENLNAHNTRPNRFVIDATIDNLDFMEHVFHYPVEIQNPANLRFSFNDVDSIYYTQISVPSLNVSGESLSQLLVEINSFGGTCRSQISGLYGSEEVSSTDISASFLAFEDIVRGYYTWTNNNGDVSGRAKSLSQFFRYDRKQGLKSMTLIDTTDIIVKGIPWHLSTTDIRTDMKKVTISGFKIRSDDQYMYLDGTVSADSTDVLNLSVHNIDLDNTLSRLHMNNMQLTGTASGDISMAGIRGKPSFQGKIMVYGFSFLGSYFGDLSADCLWDSKLGRVKITGNMIDYGVSNTMISGFYSPRDNTIDFNIGANHTDLFFLNRWTSGVFTELTARAVGNLRLFGKLPDLDLEGEAIVENARFDLESVSTSFFIQSDTLWFRPGKMLFTNVDMYDGEGHRGVLNCILDHNKFSDWRVNMTADVDDMLVYRQLGAEKSIYTATVYADGRMNLKFDKHHGLDVSVNARTSPGTRLAFTFNSSTVADYNFLTIVDRNAISLNQTSLKDLQEIDREKRKSSSNFSLDLNIECTEDALLDLSMSSLTGFMRGDGNVSVNYNPKDGAVLNGIYNLSYGQCSLSFEDLLRKDFNLMDGSYVRFNGAPMETELHLTAYHNVNSVSIYDLDPSASSNNKVHVRCLMDITGNASDPQLTFGIDMPNGTSEEKAILASATTTEEQRNIQFMYLLAIGRFYTYDAAAMNSGLTPSAMESIVNSTVSGQVNNILSQVLDNDKFTISSNLSASSYLSNDATNLNNKELEGILEAHLLNNRLLINGNFGYRENTINNTSNFIGDFEFKYLLLPDKKGKGVSIIGYNKANDKYFSKTSLTTQGVGLVFEKDF